MSLLDDLKKEVGERGAQHPEQPRVETGRVRSSLEIYLEDIRPRMHDVYHYFMKFFEYLEQIEKESGVQMKLEGYDGKLRLEAQPYYVRIDRSDEIGQVECGRRIHGPDLHMDVIGNRKFAGQCRFLDLTGLRYEKSEWRGEDGRLIGGKVVVNMNFFQQLRFKVDRADSVVDVTMSNFRHFGSAHKRMTPDELCKETYDALGTYILGRSDTSILAHKAKEVSAEARAKLQQKIAADKLAKEQELRALREEKAREKESEEQQHGGILGFASKFKKGS